MYSQVKIAFRRLHGGLPPNLHSSNESDLTITLANQAVLWFKSGERADNLYGEDVYAAVIDEASRLREESWHAVRSTLTATRGPVRIIGNVKESCPRIEASTGLRSGNPVVIVVHGAFSCAMSTAARVRAVRPDHSILRFEHDTFPPIMENVRELAGHLRRLAGSEGRTLLLLAHSRGGLVACQAVATALKQVGSIKAKVWTAGTPHRGTPLAGVGGIPVRMMGALYRICARTTDGTLRATFVEGAASYLSSTGELPPGIVVMREGSDFLDLHRLHTESLKLRTWGARCSPAADTNLRHGLLLDPALSEVFDGQENDLVVPTESAILDKSIAIDGCDHFRYFETDQVVDALRSIT